MNGRAALYLRVSREDGETSQSIENQKEFLLTYACQQGFEVCGIYADDGYSGTNFDRPEFIRMLNDIEAGKLDIVITKDLSRLGRDYIGTGGYIEKYFPERNIRFIAVNDNVDTLRGVEKTAPFMYVFNDFYPRDISDKVKAVLTHKKQAGEFIGSFAPYGYNKDPANKGRLIVNEETAEVIRTIFCLFLNGSPISEIAVRLSEEGIKTPSEYSGRITVRQKNEGIWNSAMIRRILSNPTYAGHLTQNRSKKLGVKLNKQISLPPEQWIIVPDTHEPIIPQEDFNKACELLAVRSRGRRKKEEKHILAGLVFCGQCGKQMTFQKDGGGRRYIVCSSSRKKAGGQPGCSSHCIREDFVEREVYKALSMLCKSRISDEDIGKIILDTNPKANTIQNETIRLKRKLEENAGVRYRLYSDLAAGIITPEDYKAINDRAREEATRLSSELKRLENSKKSLWDMSAQIRRLKEISEMASPDRAALLWFIGGIYINDNDTIELQFKFSDPDA